tara:strand:- start:5167 stop:6021 length:855 start_codon:yes stop_codon:yes gene_type:complete
MFITTYKHKKTLINLVLITTISLILINLNQWYFTGIGILFILFPLFNKKITHNNLAIFSMLGSIIGSYFILVLYQNIQIPILMIIITISLIIMCLLSVLGILEKNIKKYLIISNLIQFIFVILDLSVAKATGTIGSLGIIQIFNYTLAGTLFFLTLIILNKEKLNKFKDIQGYYYKDHIIGIFVIIACISLAGLPGLNIFVSEWLLFVKAFTIDPAITIIGIFIALLLFIMYFKVIYILISKYSIHKQKSHLLPKMYVILLGVLCLIFGIIFKLQFYIFDKVLA